MLNNKKNINWKTLKFVSPLFFFIILFNLKAENSSSHKKYSLDSPYDTICTHLNFLEVDNYKPHISAKAFMHEGISIEEAKSYAIKMKKIYANEGIYVNVDAVPQASNYQDPIEKYNKYRITHIKPEIYLVKVGDKWLYSRETIQHIDKLYNKIARFKIHQLYKFFPRKWHKHLYGIAIWQYIAFLMAIIGSIFLYFIFIFILNRIVKFILMMKEYTLALERYMKHSHSISKPLSWVLIILIWLVIVRPILQLPIDISRYAVSFLKLILYINICILFYRLIDAISFFVTRGVIEERFKFHTDLLPLIKKVLKVCVVILGVFSILKALNFDVSALVASISLGSLGIALASQDAIKNLFGSVMIFIDKPFSVGDMIVTKDIKGRVEEIGMRSTIIRTPEQTKIYVPNATLANTHIDNRGHNTYGNFENQLKISTKASIQSVEDFIQGFRNIIAKHPKILNGQSFVNLIDVSQSEYLILFALFFERVTYYKELMYRHEVLVEVIKLAESLGLSFDIKK